MAVILKHEEPSYISATRTSTYQEGIEYQDFVCLELAKHHILLQNMSSRKYQFSTGENLQGFEIKLDARCTETGRLSIEVAEKSKADMPAWTPSGIYCESWLYIQGNYQIICVFGTKWLRRLHASRVASGTKDHESYGTVRKFYVDLDLAREHALRVIDIA